MHIRYLTAFGAVLSCSLLAAGCSSSSSGGGGAASTAAPVTSGGSGGSSGGGTPPPPIPAAPASQGTAIDAINGELQVVWDHLLPSVLDQLNQAAQGLVGQRFAQGPISVELSAARLANTTDMTVAPGFTQFDTDRVVLRAPAQGTWQIALEADLRASFSAGPFTPSATLPVTVILEDLSLEVTLEVDDSDPVRPRLTRLGQPQLNFNLRLDASNSVASRLLGVLSQPATIFARQAVSNALSSIAPFLQSVQGIPGAVPADGAAPLVDSGTQVPFEQIVFDVEAKIRQHHQPHGILLVAAMDQPATDSWLDAYRTGGPGIQGNVVDYGGGGDAALWTGFYLAAQAYRYAVNPSPEALDAVQHTLDGLGALLDVHGGSGLLARNAAPEASLAGQQIVAAGAYGRTAMRGDTWVSRQKIVGITRDQYSGVFFGLAVAFEHVGPARAECAMRLTQMLDYLVVNDWVVDEDRAMLNGQNGSRGPTFWLGSVQKLAFLLSGHRMDPARYSAQLAVAGALSETMWLNAWTNTFSMAQYYKFNLGHAAYSTYFRLETDQSRWQHMRRAYAMIERYVGHHQNPWFDLVQTTIDPSTQAVLYGASREAMVQFLDSNHRVLAKSVIDLSGVTFVQLPQVGYVNTPGGGLTVQTTTVTFPTAPLPVTLRKPTHEFQWQRSPFEPANPNQGHDTLEKPGLDLVMPYRMGRFLGAF